MGTALGQGQEQSLGEFRKTSGEGLVYCNGGIMAILGRITTRKLDSCEGYIREKASLVFIL